MPNYFPQGTAAIATGGLAAAMQIFYDKVFLERVEATRRYDFLAVQKTVPKNSGQVVYFTRFTQMSANRTALTDGVVPTGINNRMRT